MWAGGAPCRLQRGRGDGCAVAVARTPAAAPCHRRRHTCCQPTLPLPPRPGHVPSAAAWCWRRRRPTRASPPRWARRWRPGPGTTRACSSLTRATSSRWCCPCAAAGGRATSRCGCAALPAPPAASAGRTCWAAGLACLRMPARFPPPDPAHCLTSCRSHSPAPLRRRAQAVRKGGLRSTLLHNLLGGGEWEPLVMNAMVGMGPGAPGGGADLKSRAPRMRAPWEALAGGPSSSRVGGWTRRLEEPWELPTGSSEQARARSAPAALRPQPLLLPCRATLLQAAPPSA